MQDESDYLITAAQHFSSYNQVNKNAWHKYAIATVSFRDNGLMGRKSKAVTSASVPVGTMSSAFTTTLVLIADCLLGVCDLLVNGAPTVRLYAGASLPILFVKGYTMHLTCPNR